jgi:hypothetical protein
VPRTRCAQGRAQGPKCHRSPRAHKTKTHKVQAVANLIPSFKKTIKYKTSTTHNSGGLRRTQEDSGGVRRTQEDSGGLRGTQEDAGGLRRTQEESGGHKRTQEDSGGPRETQEDSGGFRRTQEDSGGPRRTQEEDEKGQGEGEGGEKRKEGEGRRREGRLGPLKRTRPRHHPRDLIAHKVDGPTKRTRWSSTAPGANRTRSAQGLGDCNKERGFLQTAIYIYIYMATRINLGQKDK